MLSSCLSFLMPVVDLVFVGRLGSHELAAAAVANVYFQTLQHPLVGCATALDTLLAQSYGARQYDAYGAWTQTGLLVLLAMCVPFMVLLAVAEPVLLATGVERSLAVRAARFDLALIPGVPPFLLFLGLTKYLQSQSILAPSVWIAAIANAINVLVNYGLIFGLGMGLRGAPLATSVSRWVQLTLLVAYLLCTRRRLASTTPRLTVRVSELPSRVGRFLRLGLPGALMLALEAWAFELSTLMAAFI